MRNAHGSAANISIYDSCRRGTLAKGQMDSHTAALPIVARGSPQADLSITSACIHTLIFISMTRQCLTALDFVSYSKPSCAVDT